MSCWKKKNFIKTNFKRHFSMFVYLGISPPLQNAHATFGSPLMKSEFIALSQSKSSEFIQHPMKSHNELGCILL